MKSSLKIKMKGDFDPAAALKKVSGAKLPDADGDFEGPKPMVAKAPKRNGGKRR